MDRATLSQVNIATDRFDETVAFYRLLGAPVSDVTSPSDTIRHATAVLANGMELDIDNGALARMYNAAWRATSAGAGRRDPIERAAGDGPVGSAVIGFSLESREAVDRCHATLVAAGHRSCQRPWDAFWGARYAIVADPAGNPVGLMSPIDPAMKRPPADSPD